MQARPTGHAKGGRKASPHKRDLDVMIVMPMGARGSSGALGGNGAGPRPVTSADIAWAQGLTSTPGSVGVNAHPQAIGAAIRRMLAQPNVFTLLRTDHAMVGGILADQKMALPFFRQDGKATGDELANLIGALADRAQSRGAAELILLSPTRNPALAGLQPVFQRLGASEGPNGSKVLSLNGGR